MRNCFKNIQNLNCMAVFKYALLVAKHNLSYKLTAWIWAGVCEVGGPVIGFGVAVNLGKLNLGEKTGCRHLVRGCNLWYAFEGLEAMPLGIR